MGGIAAILTWIIHLVDTSMKIGTELENILKKILMWRHRALLLFSRWRNFYRVLSAVFASLLHILISYSAISEVETSSFN